MIFSKYINTLKTFEEKINLITKNISNASSINGYKKEKLEFNDSFPKKLGLNELNIGSGVLLKKNNKIDFTVGKIKKTGKSLDFSINEKNGFFKVQDSSNSIFYTKNGHFFLDKNKNIVNHNGMYLTGYLKKNKNNFYNSKMEPISFKKINKIMEAKKTSKFNLVITLNKEEKTKKNDFYPNKTNTYNFKKTEFVFDKKGKIHQIGLYFKKLTQTVWNIYPIDETDGKNVRSENILLSCDLDGISINYKNPVNIKLASLENQKRTEYFKMYIDNVSFLENLNNRKKINFLQDGYPSGNLYKFNVENNGTIIANYDNKQQKIIGKIPIINFYNLNALEKKGNDFWSIKKNWDQKKIKTSIENNNDTLNVGSLETSNVNVKNELSNMIEAQKNYQSVVQSMKTQDKMFEILLSNFK
ncbi:Flagellar hook protein FlgE [Buchnera aphidicola (Tetraneura ulmi)]|uniref:flagellar hook-basal body complex protein n=1 Tax=Buchnera aphidicola TaxID=9 RepID=UPI003464C140